MGWKRGKKETAKTHYEFLAKSNLSQTKAALMCAFLMTFEKSSDGPMKAEITFDGEPRSGSIVNMGSKKRRRFRLLIIGIRKDI